MISSNGWETATPTQTPYPTYTSSLTLELLRNAEYILRSSDGSQHSYRLTDGLYQSSTDPTNEDYIVISLDEMIAYGDLNSDGLGDAVVLLAENYGGTGIFVHLAAVRNVDGNPVHVDSIFIDDRPIINSMRIEGGKIEVDAILHHFMDAMCCPSEKVSLTYHLIGDTLVLIRLSSITPDGIERRITIDSPVDGAEFSEIIPLSGSITISPFENNLVLRIYDDSDLLVFEGPLNVSSADIGTPGTFSIEVEAAQIGLSSGLYRIEVNDISMADGSIICMAAVFVFLK
jgi:hypothetical protein